MITCSPTRTLCGRKGCKLFLCDKEAGEAQRWGYTFLCSPGSFPMLLCLALCPGRLTSKDPIVQFLLTSGSPRRLEGTRRRGWGLFLLEWRWQGPYSSVATLLLVASLDTYAFCPFPAAPFLFPSPFRPTMLKTSC